MFDIALWNNYFEDGYTQHICRSLPILHLHFIYILSFSRRSYPEQLTVRTGTLPPRQVGWSALPKDTTSFGLARIDPATFWLLVRLPHRSAIWLPSSMTSSFIMPFYLLCNVNTHSFYHPRWPVIIQLKNNLYSSHFILSLDLSGLVGLML